jgi:hypothetical protein
MVYGGNQTRTSSGLQLRNNLTTEPELADRDRHSKEGRTLQTALQRRCVIRPGVSLRLCERQLALKSAYEITITPKIRVVFENNCQSASQEILNLLWNQKVRYCVYKSRLLDLILSQMNLVHLLTPYYL